MNIDSIRNLNAEEIEIRIQSISEKGISLLLYKDARVDMTILDEVFGITGWQRIHECINGSCYCKVSIRDIETGEWIVKQDVGTESYSEPIKGAASDSFKRACTNIGIGRELYTAPFIWIPADKVRMENYNGKNICKDKFKVKSISCNERRCIETLVIVNQRNEVIYAFNTGHYETIEALNTAKRFTGNYTENGISKKQADELMHMLNIRGISVKSVLNKHGLEKLTDMDYSLYVKAMKSLTASEKMSA